MEKVTQSTLSCSLFFAETVGFLFFNTILIRVNQLRKFSKKLLHIFEFIRKSHTSTVRTQSPNVSTDEVLLSKEDVQMVMGRMGMSCSLEDEQQEETIGFSEFASLFEEKEPSLEEVKAAFSVFDENSDGFIDASELQKVLCNLGFGNELGMESCKRMIEVLDGNRDGRIDFYEFVKFLERGFC